MIAFSADFIDLLQRRFSTFPNTACWVFVGIRWECAATTA
jgi:hypothetical protein